MRDGLGSSVVVAGGTTTRGLLDSEETITTDAQGIVNQMSRVLYCRTTDFATLPARDSTITIDGTAYKVRSALVQGDGKHLKIEVA